MTFLRNIRWQFHLSCFRSLLECFVVCVLNSKVSFFSDSQASPAAVRFIQSHARRPQNAEAPLPPPPAGPLPPPSVRPQISAARSAVPWGAPRTAPPPVCSGFCFQRLQPASSPPRSPLHPPLASSALWPPGGRSGTAARPPAPSPTFHRPHGPQRPQGALSAVQSGREPRRGRQSLARVYYTPMDPRQHRRPLCAA